MQYELTYSDGKKVTISESQYNRVKDRLGSSIKVRRVGDYRERQEKYGPLGSVFPYLADDYSRNGEVSSVGGAVRRGIAGIKDVASYPGRAVAGGLNYLIRGENTIGQTSEEAGEEGGFLGTTSAIARDPLTLPSMVAVPGISSNLVRGTARGVEGLFDAGVNTPAGRSALSRIGGLGMAAGGGASVGLADNAIRQEGYGTDMKVAAGVGALTAIAPYVGVSTLNFLKNRVRNIDRMTWEELKALVNRFMRGNKSRELDDYGTMKLISTNPELVDEIARNANKPYLQQAENRTIAETSQILENTPTPPMSGEGTVRFNEYLSPKQMGKTPTTRERELAEQAEALKDRIKQDRSEGAPKALIDEDKAQLKEVNEMIKAEKSNRNRSYAEGEDQFVPSTYGQEGKTDQRTEKFFKDLRMLMDDANTAMTADWNTVEGRLRRNWKGEVYAISPEEIGNVAKREMKTLYDKVISRERSANRGISNNDPVVTNEDISNMMQVLARNNMFEHMDALMKACTWLDDATKQRIASNAFRQKAFGEAKTALDRPVNYMYEKPQGVADLAKDKLSKLPFVSFDEVKGIPQDFSRRYTRGTEGSAGRRILELSGENPRRPFFFTPAGLRVSGSDRD